MNLHAKQLAHRKIGEKPIQNGYQSMRMVKTLNNRNERCPAMKCYDDLELMLRDKEALIATCELGHYRNVRGLGKSMIVFRLFEKLR